MRTDPSQKAMLTPGKWALPKHKSLAYPGVSIQPHDGNRPVSLSWCKQRHPLSGFGNRQVSHQRDPAEADLHRLLDDWSCSAVMGHRSISWGGSLVLRDP
jgi:hypothetical protein